MDYYEKLREKLDLFPLGLPRSEETLGLLRALFTEENARVAAFVPNPPLLFPAPRIAAKAKIDRNEATLQLEEMAARGLIAEIKLLGRKMYALLPPVPGFIEMQFMMGQEMDDRRTRAGKLWHDAMDGEYGREHFSYPTSSVRVIPIKRTLDASQKVFTYEEVEKIINDAGSIAITDCACRKSARNCDAPLDVCMLFGFLADYLVEKGIARKATREQALDAFQRAADAGLVPVSTNCKPPVSIICNCCSCCCASLHGVAALNKPASSISSNFRGALRPAAECKLCGACVKSCPMKAISIIDKKLIIDETKCIGCGVCAHKCRTGSLALKRSGSAPPPESYFHLMMQMYKERKKLPKLLKSLANDIFN